MSQGIANIETAKMAKNEKILKLLIYQLQHMKMHVKKRFKFRNSTLASVKRTK